MYDTNSTRLKVEACWYKFLDDNSKDLTSPRLVKNEFQAISAEHWLHREYS